MPAGRPSPRGAAGTRAPAPASPRWPGPSRAGREGSAPRGRGWDGTWQLIQEAYTSRTWAVLGYDTWDAYCTAEFGASRLRLPREERQEVVASLRESGLSTRAIASATGISQMQVSRDIRASGEPNVSPVTGTDGKIYAPRPDPEPNTWTPAEPAAPKRRPLPEAFTDAGRDLTRATERLARLTGNGRGSS